MKPKWSFPISSVRPRKSFQNRTRDLWIIEPLILHAHFKCVFLTKQVPVSWETETFKLYQFQWCLEWLDLAWNLLWAYINLSASHVDFISTASVHFIQGLSSSLAQYMLAVDNGDSGPNHDLIFQTAIPSSFSSPSLGQQGFIFSHHGNKPVTVIRPGIKNCQG